MNRKWKKVIVWALSFSMAVGMTGCSHKKSDKKDKDKATPTVDSSAQPTATAEGKTEAGGKGNNKSDVPLIVGYSKFDKKFNPFTCVSANDQAAVRLTQLNLVTFDREGALVNKAIDGEARVYNGEEYTYVGPANIRIAYHEKEQEAVYIIKLRDDLVFSDGEPVTMDDVLFSLYAYCDSSYKGLNALHCSDIKGLQSYQKSEKKKTIAGIVQTGDYEIRITTQGYDREFINALNIPIVPLHCYGDSKAYRAEKGKFGFTKGDISSLTKKKNSPIGAGAYRFIKYESGILYYEANEKYYKECPKTAFIQLKEVGNITEQEKTLDLQAGEVDAVSMEGSNEAINEIISLNSSEKLNGGTISTRLTDGDEYVYIGLNAKNVCVDGKPDSTRSKKLRTALATLLSANRSETVELSSSSSKVLNYPNADTSWAVPQNGDEEYQGSFLKDIDGNVIYQSDMTYEERGDAACKAAIQFLKLAGYKTKKGKVITAPEGASTKFTILIPRQGKDIDVMYSHASSVKRLFDQIGLKLIIKTNWNANQIQKKIKKGSQQIWFATEKTNPNGALYEMYHSKDKKNKTAGSKNYFGLADSDLDDYIEQIMTTTRLKKSVKLYNQCFSKIEEWAVEAPLYQKRDIQIYSSSRVNMETVTADITSYYGWMDEVQNIEMK